MNEILMYGPIGEDFWEPENSITAKSIMSQLANMTGDVTVRISSGGGDVYAGIDIMNALKNYDGGEVTVIVESLAASAASFIAVGGADRVLMRASSELMIHRAWTWAEGNADEVAKTLKDLERQDTKLANIYAAKAGGTVEEWLAAMSDETWYTAEEAVAAGLADEVIAEKSTAPEPAAKLARRRFKFANRAAAPPPRPVRRSGIGDEEITTPSDGQKGDTMSIQNLAQELGVEPDQLRKKLSVFFNETVQVNTEVEISYPEDTQVVPTGKATITPVGEVPSGLTFTLGEVAEGWTAEVAEDTGVITVTAPNAEPGEQLALTVTVQSGEGEPTELTAGVTIKAAADDQGDLTPAEPAAPGTPGELAGDAVSLDRETYNELKAAAKFGWQAMEKDKESKLIAEVDAWVKDGRISASLRGKAVAAMKRDPQIARDLYGSNPKDTVPRAELGYGIDDTADGEPGLPTREDLFKRAEERRATHK
ncbi:head maturation protease, ClpP-related [Corynebacterium striatum]|uniref:head maturation protease, ClpP-related n=1 Tax=Corynebacterium striatum TaxID=43770 RepID=UPI0006696DB6|nr:head maturation protease, ClpP-related [Corynebacterium striatum]HAT1504283.1 Clp protease ClpP [Corynebacterium striatum]HAT1506843.1 Clp protease ClpP [Corynebacterium striatum]HCD1917612.1 Clp protease ClpP [Corynebacterium striatum]